MRELTDAERAMFWRARRGLKELDVFFEPFMRDHYLLLPDNEQAMVAKLIKCEDPDLLAWFMGYEQPEDAELSHIIKVIYERVGVGQSR
jgi:antitoxin CptB